MGQYKKNVRIKKWVWYASAAVVAFLLAIVLLVYRAGQQEDSYQGKLKLLEKQILTESNLNELGDSPVVGVGHAVFISVSDGTERADVFTGTGSTLEKAWSVAEKTAKEAVKDSGANPIWIKADVVYQSERVPANELHEAVKAARQEFFRVGLAFDEDFETALLEAELNGHKIYEYENGGINFEYLNNYLRKAERPEIETLPGTYTTFSCKGWICDGENKVHELYSEGLEYGRRKVELIDADYVEELVVNASEFLVEQIQPSGAFVYGMYPRFDNEIEGYNIVRHASTLWSLLCRYRMLPDEALAEMVDKAFEYMLQFVIRANEEMAFLYEVTANEFKLGASSVAVIAMTEYMDVFQNEKYVEVCRQLGEGILAMMNTETGEYVHVLDGSFNLKDEFRTVYYDGEATFALCRLYSLTGEEKWLEAAKTAVNHFIEADYTQHKDHWVAYSMNEITKHVDNPEYYTFALRNVQENLEVIYERDTTYHTYLEMLMVSFELYERMREKGITVEYMEELDMEMFLKTIYERADRMLNGYFYPEYAMYMENPQRILDTFMVRHDGYRVRIDDVQHNIGGYYLYYKYYENLVEEGMLEARG